MTQHRASPDLLKMVSQGAMAAKIALTAVDGVTTVAALCKAERALKEAAAVLAIAHEAIDLDIRRAKSVEKRERKQAGITRAHNVAVLARRAA